MGINTFVLLWASAGRMGLPRLLAPAAEAWSLGQESGCVRGPPVVGSLSSPCIDHGAARLPRLTKSETSETSETGETFVGKFP